MATEGKSGSESGNNITPMNPMQAATLLGRLLPDEFEEEQVDEPQPDSDEDDGIQSDDDNSEADREEKSEGKKSKSKSDSDEDNDAEEDDGEQPAKPRRHRFKHGDQEVEVDEPELYNGYMRQRDYTQKTQAHSASVKEFETKAQKFESEATQQREQWAAKMGTLDAALKQATPPEPDWDEARKTMKPDEYNALWIAWQQHKEKLATVAKAKRDADEAVARDRRKQAEDYVAGEHKKLLEAVPEWKDPAKMAGEMTKLVKFAIEKMGFSRDELQMATDSRSVLLMRDAYRYHELISKREAAKKANREKPETQVEAPKGGSKEQPESEGRNKKFERAHKRLAKTGSVMDAAAAIETML